MKNKEKCFHNPSDKKTFAGRFFDFLFRKNKLCYKRDDTSRCSRCNASVMPPAAYSNALIPVLYFLLSALASFFILQFVQKTIKLGVLELVSIFMIAFVGGTVLFHMVISAVILACNWREYDEKETTANELEKAKRRLVGLKLGAAIFGANIALNILRDFFVLPMCPVLTFLTLILSIVYKKRDALVISCISFVCSLVAVCIYLVYKEAAWVDIAEKAAAFVLLITALYTAARIG